MIAEAEHPQEPLPLRLAAGELEEAFEDTLDNLSFVVVKEFFEDVGRPV
jgi:hypothetical protein